VLAPRLALVVLALSAATASAAPAATVAACDSGYSYAGLLGEQASSGVAATISAQPPTVSSGHVAGWVNMGASQSRWLQVGLNVAYSSNGPATSENLYVEFKRLGQAPIYNELGQLPFGQAVRVAVAALKSRPGWWRVYVNSVPRGDYPLGQGRLAPAILAESWVDESMPGCNGLDYSFARPRVFGAGGWATAQDLASLADKGFKLERSGDAFRAFRDLSY
jgi:hypothetical protein